MEEDRYEAIIKYVAKLGIDIFIESYKMGGDEIRNAACITTLLFDGIASSLEENSPITFENMIEILKKSHAITSVKDDNKSCIIELFKGFNLN